MWVVCQNGSLINLNRFDEVEINDARDEARLEAYSISEGETRILWTGSSVAGAEEVKQLLEFAIQEDINIWRAPNA